MPQTGRIGRRGNRQLRAGSTTGGVPQRDDSHEPRASLQPAVSGGAARLLAGRGQRPTYDPTARAQIVRRVRCGASCRMRAVPTNAAGRGVRRVRRNGCARAALSPWLIRRPRKMRSRRHLSRAASGRHSGSRDASGGSMAPPPACRNISYLRHDPLGEVRIPRLSHDRCDTLPA